MALISLAVVIYRIVLDRGYGYGMDYMRHRPEEFQNTGLLSIPVSHSMSRLPVERVRFLRELKYVVAPLSAAFNRNITLRQFMDRAILGRAESLHFSGEKQAAHYASSPSVMFSSLRGGGLALATGREHFSSLSEQIDAPTHTDVVAQLVGITMPDHTVEIVRDHAGHAERDLVRIRDTKQGEIAYLHLGSHYAPDHDKGHVQTLMETGEHVLFSIHSQSSALKDCVLSALSETTLCESVSRLAPALQREKVQSSGIVLTM